jgi:hypothetical protein
MRIRTALAPGLLLALAVVNLATPGTAAAAAAKLTGGTVTPTTGTTATAFQFSVHFVGSATDEAVTVTASVAGATVALSLSGTPRNGTWTGSSTLPVGSWPVTFTAISSGGTNPTLGPTATVVVTAPTPPPTPVPTPTPTATPRPTPKPTAVPATSTPNPGNSVSPGVSPTPFGTTVTNPSGSPTGSGTALSSRNPTESPSPSASPVAAPGSRPFSVPLEGVVAIGLLGAVTVAAVLGERRRRLAVEAFRAEERSPTGAIPGEGAGNGWQRDIVDDETVATIDYEAPDEPPDPPNG